MEKRNRGSYSAHPEPYGFGPGSEEMKEREERQLRLLGSRQLINLIENNLRRSESLDLLFDTLTSVENNESYEDISFETFDAFFLKEIGNRGQLAIYRAWAGRQIGLEEASKKWQIALFEDS